MNSWELDRRLAHISREAGQRTFGESDRSPKGIWLPKISTVPFERLSG